MRQRLSGRRAGRRRVKRQPPARWRRAARQTWRSPRARLAGFGLLVVLIGLPLVLVAPFRWLAPPTTAFILQVERSGRDVDYRWAAWEEISPFVALAVVAAEDQKFPEHHGFDVASIREAVGDTLAGARMRGASTISQQVAKNLYLWPGRSLLRKGLEAYLTVAIELLWSKQRILEVYLNVAEFGDGVFGVTAASHRYFRTTPRQLTEAQAALLAAVLPSPRRLSVDNPSTYVRRRQQFIRTQMGQLGGIGFLSSFSS